MALIAGIFDPSLRLSPDDKSCMTGAMASAMQHRARGKQQYTPFDDGRLALIYAGANDAPVQPVIHAGGAHILAHDGDIRQVLQHTPQEQINPVHPREVLELFSRESVNIFPRLDGSYAAAFYEAGGALHLVRDPFGDKPLYYLQHNGILAFASELRGLTVLPFFDPTLDMDALAEFISFQYIGAPRSVYTQTRKLPPGHWLCCQQTGTASVHRYFAFTPGLTRPKQQPLPELAEELEEKLIRSLRRLCFGRNQIHACLSGGVDSSTVAALAVHHLHVPVHTFSIGFTNTEETEHKVARLYAKKLGTVHHERLIEPTISNFLQNIGSVLDEPNGDSSCLPMFTLASFLGEHTDMALTGDFADELFGGYGRYHATLAELKAYQNISLGERYYSNYILFFDETQLKNLFGYLPKAYAEHLGRLRAELDSATWVHPLHRMRRTDMENYTPGAVASKVDRMSMHHGVTVGSPFSSLDVLRFAEALAPEALVDRDQGKLILRQISYKYLPANLIDAPKRGFGLPMGGWGATNLLAMAKSLLVSPDSQLAEILGRKNLQHFLDTQNQQVAIYQVWALCVYESFLRKNKAIPGPAPATGSSLWGPIDCSTRTQQIRSMSKFNKPLIFFISSIDSIFPGFDANILHICKTTLPGLIHGIVFDWEQEKDWSSMQPYVPQHAIACLPEGSLLRPWQNKQLQKLGVKQTIVFEEDTGYVFNTKVPSLMQRITSMCHLAWLSIAKAQK